MQKQPVELFYERAVRKYFAIFTGKNLCWSRFNRIEGLQIFRTFILKPSANGCLAHICLLKHTNLTKMQLKCFFQNSRIRKVFAMQCLKYIKKAMRKKSKFQKISELSEMSGS